MDPHGGAGRFRTCAGAGAASLVRRTGWLLPARNGPRAAPAQVGNRPAAQTFGVASPAELVPGLSAIVTALLAVYVGGMVRVAVYRSPSSPSRFACRSVASFTRSRAA